MPTYKAVLINEKGDEEDHEIVAYSDGDAVRQAKKLGGDVILEREGRVVAEIASK